MSQENVEIVNDAPRARPNAVGSSVRPTTRWDPTWPAPTT